MLYLSSKPGTAGCKAQMNPLSCGGLRKGSSKLGEILELNVENAILR